MPIVKIDMLGSVKDAINHYLQSEEFKELLKEKIEQIYSQESSEIKGILSMKRYILTENGCILDRQKNECKIYAEEDGMMIEWKDAIITDTSVECAIIKDKIIKDSDTRKAIELARERLFKKVTKL